MTTVKHGWCQRCGQPYEAPAHPTCECAGEPPVLATGRRPPNFHPERRKYLARVRALRHDPASVCSVPRCWDPTTGGRRRPP